MEKEPFTKSMRKPTRGVHNISHALINAKLGVAMSDDRVWTDGLLIFYPIFKYLEEAMERLRGTVVAELDLPGMRRAAAFEKDLAFYLGEDWKSHHVPHQSVLDYLSHLSALEEREPTLLLAYIYHLYMGLFAGGQILWKKRSLARRFSLSGPEESAEGKTEPSTVEGLAVVDLRGNVYKLRKAMTEGMNGIAATLDDTMKEKLLEESVNVFKLNNEAVRHIKGANRVVITKLLKGAVLVGVLAVGVYVLCRKSGGV